MGHAVLPLAAAFTVLPVVVGTKVTAIPSSAARIDLRIRLALEVIAFSLSPQ
jgi:hypothetical protein